MKKYQIIYADPPWKYSFSETRKEGVGDYKTLTAEDISALNVKEIAHDDSILFCWMIWNRLEDCLKVINSILCLKKK